jgi:hypothetical protein
MVILILAAEGLEISRIVALAGIRLLGERREGTADGHLIQRPQPEAIHASSVPKMLEYLPRDH